MAVILAYILIWPLTVLCFWRLPLRVAALLVLLGGWLLLPVALYAPGASGTDFPWWIVGTALPSDMLLTKAWIAPLASFIGAAISSFDTIRKWRPSAIDLPMALWCLWPLVDGLLSPDPAPSPWLSSLYVTGAWGLPWLIGRMWFADASGGLILAQGLAVSGIACLPIALVEGVRPAMLYGLLYGDHPFRFDGVQRYVGYRPIGFFENGNLYGLWTALCALVAVWLAVNFRRLDRGWIWGLVAVVNLLIALASQSVGALILLLVGMALLLMWRLSWVLPLVATAAAALFILGIVHLSGVIPLQSLVREGVGQKVVGAFREVGRGSFTWRVSQDTKTLGTVAAAPFGGTARWDWWRSYNTRPWGQALLLIGQYGLIGFALAWGSLAVAAGAGLVRLRRGADRLDKGSALPLAIITLLALTDAVLNAFFFSPAILAAGAVAAGPVQLGQRARKVRSPMDGSLGDHAEQQEAIRTMVAGYGNSSAQLIMP